jgi:hypothetical protein
MTINTYHRISSHETFNIPALKPAAGAIFDMLCCI